MERLSSVRIATTRVPTDYSRVDRYTNQGARAYSRTRREILKILEKRQTSCGYSTAPRFFNHFFYFIIIFFHDDCIIILRGRNAWWWSLVGSRANTKKMKDNNNHVIVIVVLMSPGHVQIQKKKKNNNNHVIVVLMSPEREPSPGKVLCLAIATSTKKGYSIVARMSPYFQCHGSPDWPFVWPPNFGTCWATSQGRAGHPPLPSNHWW